MLALPVLESYTKMKTFVESFKDFTGYTLKWWSLKFFAKSRGNALLFTNIFQYYRF